MKAGGQGEGPGPGGEQVVDGATDRQAADVSTGKKRGSTTKESAVKASRGREPRHRVALSSPAKSGEL